MDEQQLQQQIMQLVQAAMQGDQQATQQIQQIMQAAQQGDEQAVQLAQIIQAVAQQMQQSQVQAAKFGAKLNYIKQLRGICPDGYEMKYFKSGGQLCKQCVAKQRKMEETRKTPSGPVDSFKCGRKIKKNGRGNKVTIDMSEVPGVRKSEEAKEANAYHAKQSEEYFSDPSFFNLIKGTYHWARSKPMLFGENENGFAITGEAPSPTGRVAKTAKVASTGTSVAKTAKNTLKTNQAQEAKTLYQQLNPTERKAIDITLKEAGRTLEDADFRDIFEMKRFLRGTYKPSTFNNGGGKAIIRSTENRWSGGTPTKDW